MLSCSTEVGKFDLYVRILDPAPSLQAILNFQLQQLSAVVEAIPWSCPERVAGLQVSKIPRMSLQPNTGAFSCLIFTTTL